MARRLALLISNNLYQNGKLAGLSAPAMDASALERVFRDPQIGAFDEVQTLLNRSFADIHEAVVAFFYDKKPEDLVLLYFSGHGLLDENRRLFLATPESKPEPTLLRARSIPATFIADEMSSSRSKRQVLVLDCCHSGAFSRGVKAALNQSVGTENIFQTEGAGRIVITASDATQYAFEGENLQGEGARSVFTNYLVEGLETGKADVNEDGQISINDWYQYAFKCVQAETPNQTPLIWTYGQQGEFTLARNPYAITPKPSPVVAVQTPTGRQVRTIVVDQLGRGDYATITAAIKNAKRGDRILIHEGLYNEALVIDKPLEILGDGQLGDVKIQSREKSVIWFKTTAGVVRNLFLRQTGGEKAAGVYIPQGCLRLENCDISSLSFACVEILNDGTIPILRGNKIHDGTTTGILIHDNALGQVEDNEIWGNAMPGILIKDSANPTVYKNKIYDGKRIGLMCDNADGLIEANEIWGNAKPGVGIGNGANPIVRNNKIHDGKQDGIYASDNGQGLIETNEVWGNARSGVSIETGANPTVRNNKIHESKGSGIYIHDNGQGLIDANEVWGNFSMGISISTGANPTVRGNTITKNGGFAIDARENGGGVFENNDLRDNAGGAWNISDDSQVLVKKKGNIEQ